MEIKEFTQMLDEKKPDPVLHEYAVVIDNYSSGRMFVRCVVDVQAWVTHTTLTGVYIVKVKARDEREAQYMGLSEAYERKCHSLESQINSMYQYEKIVQEKLFRAEEKVRSFESGGLFSILLSWWGR